MSPPLDSPSAESGFPAERIAAGVRTAIAAGEIGQGAPLPSLRDMATQTGHSVNTVKAAYALLLVEGLVVKGPLGMSYRVSSDPFAHARAAELRDEADRFVRRLAQTGFAHSQIVRAVKEAASR